MFCFVTASPSPKPTSETDEGLSGGAIAGIVIGVAAGLVSVVIVVVLIVGFIVYQNQQERKERQGETTALKKLPS